MLLLFHQFLILVGNFLELLLGFSFLVLQGLVQISGLEFVLDDVILVLHGLILCVLVYLLGCLVHDGGVAHIESFSSLLFLLLGHLIVLEFLLQGVQLHFEDLLLLNFCLLLLDLFLQGFDLVVEFVLLN